MAERAGLTREFGRSRRAARAASAAVAAVGLTAALSACGSSAHFKDIPRPPTPVDLSVYIDNSHVSISPSSVGAGPVILYVTNQASNTQTLAIERSGGSAIASSGHIDSGETAQVTADLKTGTYDIATGGRVTPAKLKIGKPRPNADNALLQP